MGAAAIDASRHCCRMRDGRWARIGCSGSGDAVKEDERLTTRQREVLQLLAEGKVMKEVGGILNMTTRTVAYHKYRMMEVLGAKSNAELVKYAVRNHLVAA